jgi:hypothetical protein
VEWGREGEFPICISFGPRTELPLQLNLLKDPRANPAGHRCESPILRVTSNAGGILMIGREDLKSIHDWLKMG